MLNKLDLLEQRVTGKHPVIKQLLSDRRELLIAYYQLIVPATSENIHYAFDEKLLDNFCQLLVDYLSCGHFRHFEQVEAVLMEQQQPQLLGIFPRLQENTDKLLSIYDQQLEQAIANKQSEKLVLVLSELGECLESRFVLEDQLLVAVNDRYQQATSPAEEVEKLAPEVILQGSAHPSP